MQVFHTAGVPPNSETATYGAIKLHIDNWRWQGVPFFIRAGKCLPVTCTEIVVRLRQTPSIFKELNLNQNHFRIRISPDITVAFGLNVMAPLDEQAAVPVEVLGSHFSHAEEMDAYALLERNTLEKNDAKVANNSSIDP